MSLITLIATKNFVSILTDGRIYGREKDKSVCDNFCKYTKLDDDIVIAGGGTFNATENIKKIAKNLYNKGYNLEEIVHKLKEILIKEVPRESNPEIKVNIALAGINSEKQIVAYSIDNKIHNSIERYLPTGNQYISLIIMGDKLGINESSDKLDSYLHKNQPSSPQEYILVQKEFNDYVASIDKKVNTTHYQCIIEKI